MLILLNFQIYLIGIVLVHLINLVLVDLGLIQLSIP